MGRVVSTVRIDVAYDDGKAPQSFTVTGSAIGGDVAAALDGAFRWAHRVLDAADATP